MNKQILQAGVVGIGGYASFHHEAMQALEAEGLVKVRSTCDPKADELRSVQARYGFEARGVRVSPDIAGMFSEPLDLVTVSAPIHLHAAMHRTCVERGAACYLEKPPTLNPVELASMIEVDRIARKQTHVGFHLLHQSERLALKQRMISGEFGTPRRVAFVGTWRRPLSYFQRNSWAGRLTLGGAMLLDSSFANAMAHYVNAVLFFAGEGSLYSWASPVRAAAELYRANSIQGTDTVFVRAELENGVPCHIATTHACEAAHEQREIYEFDGARIEIRELSDASITFRDGRQETASIADISLVDNLRDYISYLNGLASRPNIRLEDCRPFVNLNALLYLAAPGIADIPAACLRSVALPEHQTSAIVIDGIKDATERFAESGIFPSESGLPWGRSGGVSEIGEIDRLDAALKALTS
ncbi:Gfo/Idh/MocA family oxidoreductase [soil metagenome]